jgi:hypothetical protein
LRLNAAIAPIVPIARPRYVAPCACAASSMTTRLARDASAMISSMSAGSPCRWTGTIARVRAVTRAAASRASML